jgi:hypothetical protein
VIPEQPAEAVVVVLVDDKDSEAAIRLALEGIEQTPQLSHTLDGGDHEVE